MGSNTQINLDYDQLVHCVKYNILFFCEQMVLEKQGNEHTCESAIYTNQNEKLIQQKCTIEYYPYGSRSRHFRCWKLYSPW